MATLLSVVNDVLVRLREEEVVSVNENIYSKLLVQLVNDTKQEIENAWDWTFLRTNIDVTLIPGTDTYSLVGTNKRTKVLYAVNFTASGEVVRLSNTYLDMQAYSGTINSAVVGYVIRGLDASAQLKVTFYPPPDNSDVIRFFVINPQDKLVAATDDATDILIPEEPLILGTLAKALVERGEDGGNIMADLQRQYKLALSDAISMDYNRNCSSDKDWVAY